MFQLTLWDFRSVSWWLCQLHRTNIGCKILRSTFAYTIRLIFNYAMHAVLDREGYTQVADHYLPTSPLDLPCHSLVLRASNIIIYTGSRQVHHPSAAFNSRECAHVSIVTDTETKNN